MDVDSLAAGYERIDGFVIDEDDFDIVGIKTCCCDQGRRNFVEKCFSFCVALD